jgi:colanic acid/amylovoran biosynthesis protein
MGQKRTKYNRIRMLTRSIFLAFLYILWAKINFKLDERHETVLKLFREADVVIVGGGGSYGARKMGSVFIDLFPMYFAKTLGKKVMVYAPSVEPFKSQLLKKFSCFVLNRVDVITVREEYSFDVLKKLKLKTPVHVTADPAFLVGYESNQRGLMLFQEANIPTNTHLRIGMTIKNGPLPSTISNDYSNKTPYQKYFNAHVDAIKRILAETDAIVVLFTTSIFNGFTSYDDDRIISQRVRDAVPESLRNRIFVLMQNYTPEETKAMIGMMDVFIATRTHSGIFAMSMNVPLLAISYEFKTNGILKMMDLEDQILDIKSLTAEELVSSLHKLIQKRQLVAQRIQKRLPVVQSHALRNGEFVDQLLRGN